MKAKALIFWLMMFCFVACPFIMSCGGGGGDDDNRAAAADDDDDDDYIPDGGNDGPDGCEYGNEISWVYESCDDYDGIPHPDGYWMSKSEALVQCSECIGECIKEHMPADDCILNLSCMMSDCILGAGKGFRLLF